MRLLLAALYCAAALAVGSQPLAAQRSSPRRGPWLGFGAGAGSARVSCPICQRGRDTGFSGYFRLGATVNQNLLLGAEVNGFYSRRDGGADELLGLFGAVAYLYPGPESGFYVKGGVGLVAYRLDDDTDALTYRAPGVQLGVGYELRLNRALSVTPYVNAMGSTAGSIRFNGTKVTGSVTTSLLQIGAGVTWH